MTSPSDAAVAVYLDFDNIVISRYDQVHGKGSFWRARDAGFDEAKLDAAEVDVHAILDFASSFGRLALTRAYADWSMPVNSRYRRQLVDRAVDLVQLFPASGSKNGADIRLALDALEDVARSPGVATIVLAAGDSDYIPLAQRLRRMNRTVIAVGVVGSVSRSLAAAVDELVSYDNLPGLVRDDEDTDTEPAPPPAKKSTAKKSSRRPATDEKAPEDKAPEDKPTEKPAEDEAKLTPKQATRLLMRALRLLAEKEDDSDWVHASSVKNQMKRMDSRFSEKDLGSKSFSDFIKSRNSVVELDETHQTRKVRLRPGH